MVQPIGCTWSLSAEPWGFHWTRQPQTVIVSSNQLSQCRGVENIHTASSIVAEGLNGTSAATWAGGSTRGTRRLHSRCISMQSSNEVIAALVICICAAELNKHLTKCFKAAFKVELCKGLLAPGYAGCAVYRCNTLGVCQVNRTSWLNNKSTVRWIISIDVHQLLWSATAHHVTLSRLNGSCCPLNWLGECTGQNQFLLAFCYLHNETSNHHKDCSGWSQLHLPRENWREDELMHCKNWKATLTQVGLSQLHLHYQRMCTYMYYMTEV